MLWLVEFIFPRRLHRLAYFLRGVTLDIVTGFLYANSTTFKPGYWWPGVVLLIIYGLCFVILPRIRDVGMSSWWLFATLIPVADAVLGIILLFRTPVFLPMLSPNHVVAPNGDPATPSGNSGVAEASPSVT